MGHPFTDVGLVVRTYDLGEADRIVTLLTGRHGLVRAVARAVRRTRSRMGASLEAFSVVEVQIAPGRGRSGLGTIRQASSLESLARPIVADYPTYTSGCVILETAERLAGEEGTPAGRLLGLAVAACRSLAEGRRDPSLVSDAFGATPATSAAPAPAEPDAPEDADDDGLPRPVSALGVVGDSAPASVREHVDADDRADGVADASESTEPASEENATGAGADAGTGVPAGSGREAELEEDLRRLQAEYVNYKRRVDRDRDLAKDQGVLKALLAVLPVLDDIDAGRQHGDLVDGPFAAIAGKLEGILATYGLARIDEVGVAFDPNIHEALIQQPSADVQSDSVSQILRVGYRKDQRVLRAAQVIVAVPE